MPIRRAAVIFAITCMAVPAVADAPVGMALAEGIRIDLGKEWSMRETVNPAVKMPMMKDLLDDAREYRLRKGDTGILISYMGFKTKAGSDPARFDAAETTRKAAGRYLAQAQESEVSVEQATNGNVVTTLATLHAREGESFPVGIGYSGACVTTGNMRHADKLAIFAISVASKSCDATSHKEAVAALMAAHD